MCGRLARDRTTDELAWEIDFAKRGGIIHPGAAALGPTWNGAPMQLHPAIVAGAMTVEMRPMRWGWRRDFTKALLVNALGEDAWAKRTWREAFLTRRCLVPATAFYEWTPKAITGAALPWAFARRDRRVFGIAGLWERVAVDSGEEERFILLTTVANQMVGRVHHRMAAIVAPEAEETWLSPASSEASLRSLLVPPPVETMDAWRVSPAVNSVRNNDRGLIEPIVA